MTGALDRDRAVERAGDREDWTGPAAGETDDGSLYLELDGWEGPLDLLLDLARRQKVDLRAISILDLVEQYLAYIERAEQLRLELAADYLVMAAWLAYLKSALLLPAEEREEPDAEELALRLQLRLRRLGAMREAAARLMARDRLGRDVFARGAPEGLRTFRRTSWKADWFDLVDAYGRAKMRSEPVIHMVRQRPVVALETALRRLSDLLRDAPGWTELRALLPGPGDGAGDSRLARSALASHFAAALELARTGAAELAQDTAFAPLRVRSGR